MAKQLQHIVDWKISIPSGDLYTYTESIERSNVSVDKTSTTSCWLIHSIDKGRTSTRLISIPKSETLLYMTD